MSSIRTRTYNEQAEPQVPMKQNMIEFRQMESAASVKDIDNA
ncbi:hypothetical protein F441_02816 [Phytophthora nicotianae CJ01A1]|uniref:Uncharacterized protein n=2 Tax=Phytophthora nicotianae TaxID=4792 RepID=W2XML9_PHYNI|nr:hypothetical protein L915_02721 [Phytophthora nicotianae]ETP24145.1 hypothetical protein F441_02816 [Phytophthora nicotianae CJ01A1]